MHPAHSSDTPPKDVEKEKPIHIIDDLRTRTIVDVLGDKPRTFHEGHIEVSVYTTNGWDIYIWGGRRGRNMIFVSAEYSGGNRQIVHYVGKKEAGNTMMKFREKMGLDLFVRKYIATPERKKPGYFQKPQAS